MNPILKTITCLALLLSSVSATAQCHFIPSTSTSIDTINYTFNGGVFASYGCAPIDPNYWMAGSGAWITATFVEPEDFPSIRVWGMNDDDVASIVVNTYAYFLDETTAWYSEKVVCGQSPGPDGILFTAEGNFAGANDNSEGNYSYQDITINMAGVSSITVNGISGAGWGFAGVSVDCVTSVDSYSPATFSMFPNPTAGIVFLHGQIPENAEVTITNEMGSCIQRMKLVNNEIDISGLSQGVYLISVRSETQALTRQIIKM